MSTPATNRVPSRKTGPEGWDRVLPVFSSFRCLFLVLLAAGACSKQSPTVRALELDPPGAVLVPGTSQSFSVTGVFSDGSRQDLTDQVDLASSDEATMTLGAPATATAVKAGSAHLIATHTPTGTTGRALVVVAAAPLASLTVTPNGHAIDVGDFRQFAVLATYGDGSTMDLSTQVHWSAAPAGVIAISNERGSVGFAVASAAGVVTVTATLPGSAITGTAALTVRELLDPASLAKFVDPLPRPSQATPTAPNQYELAMSKVSQRLHRDLPVTELWGYGGSYPGPTIEAQTGTPVTVKWTNNLPAEHLLPVDTTIGGADMGAPLVRQVVHLHGGHVPPGVDGNPEAWYTPGLAAKGPAFSGDSYTYPNDQPAATLWYHDHAMGVTRLNVYAGLAGFYLLRDAYEQALNLPSGAYEIPLAIQDRSLHTDGSLAYPAHWWAGVQPTIEPEVFGNVILVNGKVWPYLEVEPRRYRFRVLNGSNSRVYGLSLSNGMKFQQIGTDGGLLAAMASVSYLVLMPGERADLVLDFAGLAGTTIELKNDAPSPYPDGDPVDEHTAAIMQFRVSLPLSGTDTSVVPPAPRPVVPLDPATAATTRTLRLMEDTDALGRLVLTLDNKRYSDAVTEKPKLGSVEVWRFINGTPDAHPIHLHLVEFQILDRQGFDLSKYEETGQVELTGTAEPPAANEAGWKDTVRVPPGSVTRVVARFDGWTGRYVWHCHILEHEDNEMMRPFEVVP